MKFLEMTSPQLGRVARNTVAILPVAALEQHGSHLPVGTDTLIASEISARVEKALPRKVVLLPTVWSGSSHHHLGFPGTVSLSSGTFSLVVTEMVESLLKTGFRRIILLNGHGGNTTPIAEALYQLNLRLQGPREPWIAGVTYWHAASQELKAQKFMDSPALTHACEYETSLILAIRGELVRMSLAREHRSKILSPFYNGVGEPPARVYVSETFRQLTPTGSMGRPQKATVEKGRKLLGLIVPVIVDFVKDFQKWKHRSPHQFHSIP